MHRCATRIEFIGIIHNSLKFVKFNATMVTKRKQNNFKKKGFEKMKTSRSSKLQALKQNILEASLNA